MKIKLGFSLIEVLVFVTILSLFFVAAMSVATYSLKNMKINQHKILASHYAEEGLEWIRAEKEENWDQFIGYGTTGSGLTYCINTLNNSIWTTPTTCGANFELGVPQIFKREVNLINQAGNPVTQVDVTLTVTWIESGSTLSIPLKTTLKILE
ncbi:MAG: hypothetical protein UR89_C0013G0016 [Candidatus Roizmanbacteria bacterium GW2011_GWA2_35_8]|uniref:Uncharacterized protein n=1 Tax=Candidatus Roizmanbacteria bacterium GW2011_GWA2_35_8 TaxID=1618479 RepID=A0A0G0D0H9_9BACT|nr:MAG: hypothetical protein UR89_C0013G0016 [Candidatus Roizmanbacteria bacterium GW2011_GWA2_35_8]